MSVVESWWSYLSSYGEVMKAQCLTVRGLLLLTAILCVGAAAGETIAATKRGEISIWAVADTHFTSLAYPHMQRLNEQRQDRKFRAVPEWRANFDIFLAMVSEEKPDMVVVCGDVTETGHEQEMRDYLAAIKATGVAFRHLPGNHDVGDRLVPERHAQFEKHFGPAHWFQDVAGVRLIGLDTSRLWKTTQEQGESEIRWLIETVALGEKPFVVFSHIAPFIKSADEPHTFHNLPTGVRKELLQIVSPAPCLRWIAGHSHIYRADHKGAPPLTILPSMLSGYGNWRPGFVKLRLREGTILMEEIVWITNTKAE